MLSLRGLLASSRVASTSRFRRTKPIQRVTETKLRPSSESLLAKILSGSLPPSRKLHTSSRILASDKEDAPENSSNASEVAEEDEFDDDTDASKTKNESDSSSTTTATPKRKRRALRSVIPSPRPNEKVMMSSGASIPAHRIDANMMPLTTFLMPLADGVPLYEGARWVYELTPQDLDRKLFYMRTNHVVLAFMRRPDDTVSLGPVEAEPVTATEISEVPQGDEAAKPKADEKTEDIQSLKDEAADELVRVHRVGFFSRVKWSPDTTKITFWPQVRVEISNVRALNSGMIGADIKPLIEPEYSESDLKAIRETVDKIVGLVNSMVVLNPTWTLSETAKDFLVRAKPDVIPDPVECLSLACNLIANDTLNGIVDFQRLVAAVDARERAKVVLDYFTVQEKLFRKYFEMSKSFSVNKDESKQREVYQQLLQEAQQEWGGSADAERQKMIDKFKKRIEGLNVPREAMTTIEEQLGRLSYYEPAQSEYGLTVAYLDILTQLPWGVYTQDNFDIDHAKKTLDTDHYGLKDVKDRILEFIAVSHITKNVQGKILCFVGPPGTGKTSIAKSIATALGRKYARISLGGMHDIHEIKGHRRTYVGAMPGQVIKLLKQCGSANPLILLDEVDKASNVRGDATTALLEVLDPSQNSQYVDSYMDIPVDLSKVLFVCTANRLSTIPPPLLDRMEVVHLDGYLEEEKFQIAKRHLVPSSIQKTNLSDKELSVSDAALREIVKFYCREPGVRDLKQQIEKAFGKASLSIAKKEHTAVKISSKNISTFLGPAPFPKSELYQVMPPGLCFALSEYAAQHVECSIYGTLPVDEPEESRLHITGKADQVMRESCMIAYTYARNFLAAVDRSNTFFQKWALHVHLPEGALEKTGTGAGCAVVTALLSLAMNRPLRRDLVVAGELTLTGKVLPVSNVKALALSAKRHEANLILLPRANEAEWDDLDSSLRSGVQPHFIDYYSDVFGVAFAEHQPEVTAVKGETNNQSSAVSAEADS